MFSLSKLLEALGAMPREAIFPDEIARDAPSLIFEGGELSEATVLEAYSKGCFPWTGEAPIPWHSPNPRLILPPAAFHASKNLRKLARQDRYTVRFDNDFQLIMGHCASIPRDEKGTWITPNMKHIYYQLHQKGITHCVGVYRDEQLVGGLYGLALGCAFFGESMFSREANTSKLALFALCQRLATAGFLFIDCQQVTRHLLSLGAVPVHRHDYLKLLKLALNRQPKGALWHAWNEGNAQD